MEVKVIGKSMKDLGHNPVFLHGRLCSPENHQKAPLIFLMDLAFS